MYSRYPNYRFGGGIKIPENYSGNAFAASEVTKEEEREELEETAGELEKAPLPSATDAESASVSLTEHKRRSPFGFNFNLGRLFSGGFGFEELLLIALILLVSQNDTGDDLILFLALLLFVG